MINKCTSVITLSGVVLILIIVLLTFNQSESIKIIYGNHISGYTVDVPQEIVKKQDCLKYRQWAKKNRDVFFTQDSCPWSSASVRTGHFSINGIKFHVPRDYLYSNNDASDGEYDNLFIAFTYPDSHPLTKDGWMNILENEVTVQLINVGNLACSNSKTSKVEICDPSLFYYKLITGVEHGKTSKPIYLGNESKINMDVYKWDHPWGESYGYYIKGNPLNPSHWLYCNKALCESFINYAYNKVVVRYTFHASSQLENQETIQKAVIDLINSWRVDNE